MRNVQEHADLIQMQIKEAELADDHALLAKIRLMQSMIQARIETDVQPMEGQAALLRLHQASKFQLDARGNLGRVHADLTSIGEAVSAELDHKTYPPSGTLTEEIEKV